MFWVTTSEHEFFYNRIVFLIFVGRNSISDISGLPSNTHHTANVHGTRSSFTSINFSTYFSTPVAQNIYLSSVRCFVISSILVLFLTYNFSIAGSIRRGSAPRLIYFTVIFLRNIFRIYLFRLLHSSSFGYMVHACVFFFLVRDSILWLWQRLLKRNTVHTYGNNVLSTRLPHK